MVGQLNWYLQGNGLPGVAMASGGVVGDQLGEMGQQMGWTADAVLGKQAAVGQVTNGSVRTTLRPTVAAVHPL